MKAQSESERLYCICIGAQGNVEAYDMDVDIDTSGMGASPTAPRRKHKARRGGPEPRRSGASGLKASGVSPSSVDASGMGTSGVGASSISTSGVGTSRVGANHRPRKNPAAPGESL